MPSRPYVTIDYVKIVGSMPAADVDALEALYPGTFVGVVTAVSAMFDARLAKRYAVPFGGDPFEPAQVPEAIKWHVAAVVVYTLWKKRGFNPSSDQDALIEKDRDEALAWLKEAADSKDGLVELPLRADSNTSGIIGAKPISAHQASPYAWTDEQAYEGRIEDRYRYK